MILAGFLLILRHIALSMFRFVKNFLRKRLLKRLPAGIEPVFPTIDKLGDVAVVFKMDKGEDAVHLMTMVERLVLQGAQFRYFAVETGKCFKESRLRDEFVQWCKDKNVGYIGKSDVKWSGAPVEFPQHEVFNAPNDMLVVLNDTCNFTTDYLALNIKAKFIASNKESSFIKHNLVLQTSNRNFTAMEYMENLFDYLRKMSRKDGE